MAQLTRGMNRLPERFRFIELLLTAGQRVYQGGAAFIVNGQFVEATAAAGNFFAGVFKRDYDATAAAKRASVDVGREVIAWWFSNATAADAATAANVGDLVYFTDDNTVSPVSTGRSLCGRCWGFNATTNELLVERLDPVA